MEKPTNPYRRGSRWLIHSHTPPPPPNHRAHRIKRGEVRQIRAEGFIEHCLANPPLQGSLGHQEFSMAITEELSVQDGHGAQVVAVKVDGREDTLVAKIYDPFYYPDPTQREERDPNSDICWMPTRAADYHYCNEVTVYRSINGKLGGKVVPQYHGAFSTDLVFDRQRMRSVQLILMERIPGVSLLDLEPELDTYPLEHRKVILSKMIDAESALYHHMIDFTDFAPRNIMLTGKPGQRGFRLRILDFAEALLMDEGDELEETTRSTHGAISPILRWRTLRLDTEWTEWIDWDYEEWLDEHWKGTDFYAPITQKMRAFWLGPPGEWRASE